MLGESIKVGTQGLAWLARKAEPEKNAATSQQGDSESISKAHVVNWPRMLLSRRERRRQVESQHAHHSTRQQKTQRQSASNARAKAGNSSMLGRVASGALNVLGPLGKFGVAAINAARILDNYSEEQIKQMRKLSTFSPSMAVAFAERDIQDMMREMRMGEALAESAKKALDAEQRAKTASEPFNKWWGELGNNFTRRWNNLQADVLDQLNDWFGASSKKGPLDAAASWLAILGEMKTLATEQGRTLKEIRDKVARLGTLDEGWTAADLVEALAEDDKHAAASARGRVESLKRTKTDAWW
jgi:hypothetical protein